MTGRITMVVLSSYMFWKLGHVVQDLFARIPL